MIDIYRLYLRFCSEVNTSQNGFFRPQTDFEKKANSINMQIWTEWTAMAEKTQEIRDNLSPFLKHANIILKNQGPVAIGVYPAGYSRFSSAKVVVVGEDCYSDINVNDGKCVTGEDPFAKAEKNEAFWNKIKEWPVTNIGDDRWASAVSHHTRKPTLKNALLKQTDTGFEIKPRSVSVIVINYYFKPPYVKFNYTLSPGNPQTGAGDQIIYNASDPGEFLWDETMINEFLKRLREAYFGFTRDPLGNSINNSQKVA